MTANNYALKFDKTQQDRVDFSTSLTIQDLTTFTFEAWVKVGALSTSSEQRAFAMRQGNGKKGIRFACTPYKDKLRFELARVDNTSDTNYTCDVSWDDYWHHVAFTADLGINKEYKIYFDGALKQKGTLTDGGQTGGVDRKISNTASGSIRIGGWNPNNDSNYTYWDGKIDNIRLWNTVLDQSTLQAKMWDHILTPGTESGLIEEIRLNEGTGTSTAGAKNAGWTGTLRRAGATSSALWTTDRPWLGDLAFDESAPANMTMTAPTSIGSTGFTTNWNTTTDNVYVQFYELTVATDAAFSSPVSGYSNLNVGLVTTYAITGLTPATNHYARIRAVDAAGNASAWATYNTNAAITTTSAADLTAPTAPTQSSTTSVSSTGFTSNWSAATDNVAVTGYKIDVATDVDFTSFVSGFRNLDVGLVLTKPCTGLLPLTSYFVRVRAYDAAGNESVDSNVVQVTTTAPPDTTPPAVVVTLPPTSLGARSATLNWNVGIDNVAVTGYRLDVALDSTFTTYLTGFNNLNVSNVTSYGLTSLDPSTGYWYRVRAYDAAGNVSSNTTSPEQFITMPSSVLDGGTILTTRDATQDTYVWQTNASTNYGTSTVMQIRGGAGDVAKGLLTFDLTDLVGTIVNANLRIYLEEDTGDQLQVQRLSNVSINASTATWTSPTLTTTGDALTFYGNGDNAWVEIDIASIIPASASIYNFVISKAGATASEIRIQTLESSNHPELVLEADPLTATQIDTISVVAQNTNYTNYLKNPSAEIGGTSFGGTTGIAALAGATLLQDVTYAYDGTYSAKCTTTTTINDGIKFSSATGLAIPAVGQTLRGQFAIRSTSLLTVISAVVRIYYTDASTSASPLTETVTVCNIAANAGWQLYDLTTVAASGKTIDSVELLIYKTVSGGLVTFWVDAATITDNRATVTFHGSTSVDTKWNGTVNASSSQFQAAELVVDSTYLGDANDSNNVIAYMRPSQTTDWIRSSVTPTVNRGTKRWTATIPGLQVGNHIANPSFTNNLDGWDVLNAASITRITTDGMEALGALDMACMQVSCTSDSTDGVICTQRIPSPSTFLYASAYMKAVSGASTVRMEIRGYYDNNTIAITMPVVVTLTSEWQRFSVSVGTPGGVAYATLALKNDTATSRVFLVDHVQFERAAQLNPYIDGTQSDGLWSGLPHQSMTMRRILHDADYDVRFQYLDSDGIDGTNEAGAGVHTPFIPDNVTSTSTLLLTPEDDRIFVEASYIGDDNNSNAALVQWKRADLSTWNTVASSIGRTSKTVYATIAGLYPGTAYDVQTLFTDSDGVYGLNPLTGSTVTTTSSIADGSIEYISFGGFVLSGNNDGDIWVTSHNAFDMPDRRLQIEDMPRTDGAVQLSDWWGAREIKMRGVVKGETRAELFSNLEALRRCLALGEKPLVVDSLSYTNRHFIATCESFECPEEAGDNYLHLEWQAKFTCADPFRYAAEETVESNIAMVDGGTVVITNDGDLSIDPHISLQIFNPTAVSLTLANDTTGERITPSVTFVTNDVLTIDCARLSLLKNGVEVDYAGGYPRLAVGQNTFRLVLSAGAATMTVRRRHRFF